jgi:hypothetical protein
VPEPLTGLPPDDPEPPLDPEAAAPPLDFDPWPCLLPDCPAEVLDETVELAVV